ncbi:SDR family oxidoreductase [Acuticoccus mangrovi]|uniref:SDR family oxidoreductase n=1 Tax=Acuticoccus mangrovi TaxID=2796142 RepID=A0A934INZ6_9HYPH|nr:SDR family oxidoreductase [Acuticoccus mangrovi]MBJ3777377.1 SDR family oxidoreductase [Acuticoccus mangrovi]
MHVFVTGATGWVGTVVVGELLGAGHRVSGLARSPEKAAALAEKGATVVSGTLGDLDLLHRSAAAADAVIHTAFNHDFTKFAANCEEDRRAIEAMGAALEGSDKPLLVTSGLAMIAPGRVVSEEDPVRVDPAHPRRSEPTAQALAERGVRAATMRLAPSVHGVGDHGFVPILIRMARETGVSAYIGEGLNRWPAVHRNDAGRLYRLALEAGLPAAVYHAVAEEGIAFKEIAAVIGKRLGVPVESRPAEHFGWFADFAGADMPASSALTRERVGFAPTEPGLLSDLDQPAYFA